MARKPRKVRNQTAKLKPRQETPKSSQPSPSSGATPAAKASTRGREPLAIIVALLAVAGLISVLCAGSAGPKLSHEEPILSETDLERWLAISQALVEDGGPSSACFLCPDGGAAGDIDSLLAGAGIPRAVFAKAGKVMLEACRRHLVKRLEATILTGAEDAIDHSADIPELPSIPDVSRPPRAGADQTPVEAFFEANEDAILPLFFRLSQKKERHD
jgi:hypothetical protein